MIFHITKRSEWLSQKASDVFIPADFQREGFTHCCTREQMDGVLHRYFKGQDDLIALHIEEDALQARLVYEPSTNNEEFPHIYGGINKSAIRAVKEVE